MSSTNIYFEYFLREEARGKYNLYSIEAGIKLNNFDEYIFIDATLYDEIEFTILVNTAPDSSGSIYIIDDLTKLSEEEFFQYSLTSSSYSTPGLYMPLELVRAIQKEIYESFCVGTDAILERTSGQNVIAKRTENRLVEY